MPVVAVTPMAHEASDGRIVVAAPARTTTVEVRVAGVPTRVRLLTSEERGGRLRITVQVAAIARTGADLEIVARRGTRELGRTVVADVHLLGEAAFAAPMTPLAGSRASQEARDIVRAAGGRVGLSIECLGTGRAAAVDADRRAVAASTLKVAILAAALGLDRASPTRSAVYTTYRDAIVNSNNDAANRVLTTLGAGSVARGAERVNALMAHLEMRRSFLDGAYRLTARPSQKRTSAADLRRMARAIQLAATGRGPLVGLGVSAHEARVLIGLMASEVHPGLIREHVPGPVAHKAGWLDSVQNDVALAFGTRGGTCLVGITTEGLSFAAADAVGRDVADRVLPLLAAPRRVARSQDSPAPPAAEDPAPTTRGGGGLSWGWLGAAAGLLAVAVGGVVRRVVVLRRRIRRRSHARLAGRSASSLVDPPR